MGRITIFTANDIHSHFLKVQLEKRNLPYTEISLSAFPERQRDLSGLACSYAIPSCFFNTRPIGGVKETLQLLSKWDSSSRFATPRDRYEAEIGRTADPSSPYLAKPTAPSTPPSSPSSLRLNPKTIHLPNGLNVSVLDLTEKLRNSIPTKTTTYKKVVYTHSFTGQEAVETFKKTLSLNTEEAVTFGVLLQDSSLLDHVCQFDYTAGQFRNSPTEVYRLQCYKHPQVLNSYRIWNEPVNDKPLDMLSRLDLMLNAMEVDSLNDAGKIDFEKIMNQKDLSAFEEAVCELQGISMVSMTADEKTVFSINVFRLMLRYAFLKVGIVSTETGIKTFFKSIQFNVGGNLFSFRDWVDGMLRSNKKSYFSKTQPFSRTDQRRSLALPKMDKRIHFALYAGAPYGSSCSLPFRQFTVEGLEEELNIAASVYCNDETNLKIDTDTQQRKVELSPILQWYQTDFGKDSLSVLHSLKDDVAVYRRQELSACLADTRSMRLRYGDLQFLGKNFDSFAPYHPAPTDIKGVAKLMRRWKPAVAPENERIRLTTLRRLNVLDTLREDRYDQITAEVKKFLNVPIVFISLVDENRQWFKSTQWTCSYQKPSETARDISFCGHAINNQDNDIFIVPDALADDRFAESPLVINPPYVRFYAGYTLMVPAADGGPPVKVGALCVNDLVARPMLTEEQMDTLRAYGRRVVAEMIKDYVQFDSHGNTSFVPSPTIMPRQVAV